MNDVMTLCKTTIVPSLRQCCFLLMVLPSFVACSGLSYDAGRSSTDLPPVITSLYVENVIPLREDFTSISEANNSPIRDTNASADEIFLAKIIQSDIAIDLMRKGYKVTHDSLEDHDMCLTILFFYQPDEWPIANRSIHLMVEVSQPKEPDIFYAESLRKNWFGSIGDYIGFSSEKMIADAAHEDVDLILAQFPSKKIPPP